MMTDINKKDAEDIQQGPIPETITFHTADRMTYGALGYDGNERRLYRAMILKLSSICGL